MFAMPRSATQPSRIPIVDYSTLSLQDKGIFDRWQLENPDAQPEEVETWKDKDGNLPLTLWYKNVSVSINIPFRFLKFFKKYRNVHESNVEKMFTMYTGGAYLPAHSLTVRAVKEHPNTYEIVDGLHRFLAMQRIVKIFGVTGLAQMIGGGKRLLRQLHSAQTRHAA